MATLRSNIIRQDIENNALDKLDSINKKYPEIGFVLLQGLAKELSKRLRLYNYKVSLTK